MQQVNQQLPWAAAALLALFFSLPAARAHEASVPLTFWADNFASSEARCQLEVGAGASTCGLRAWAIRRDCHLSQLDGAVCDEDADDDAIQQLRLDIFQGDISPVCREADLDRLLFADLQDVQFDVITFCRDLESAAVSLVFNPLFRAGDAANLDDTQKQCIRTFAKVATQAFNYSFRSRRAPLDRIANRRRSATTKKRDVGRSNTDVTRANDRLRTALERGCAPTDFEATYAFDTAAAIELATSRAACLADQTYPVLAYLEEFACPEAVCGNGMRESGERCDDANTEDGDGCSSRCQIEF